MDTVEVDMLIKTPALRADQAPNGVKAPACADESREIFISYCREDAGWLVRLKVHLDSWRRTMPYSRRVEYWDDSSIPPGSDWMCEVERAIARARVAILLVSADYLASAFIAKNELPPIINAVVSRGLVVLPVIVGPCRFAKTEELSRFQAVNDPRRALNGLSEYHAEQILLELTDVLDRLFGG